MKRCRVRGPPDRAGFAERGWSGTGIGILRTHTEWWPHLRRGDGLLRSHPGWPSGSVSVCSGERFRTVCASERAAGMRVALEHGLGALIDGRGELIGVGLRWSIRRCDRVLTHLGWVMGW